MKLYVSYVIQNENGHTHDFEIIEVESPPYTYSPDPMMHLALVWAEEKQKDLKQDQKLVVISSYKI